MMKKQLLILLVFTFTIVHSQSIVKDINIGFPDAMPTYAKNRIAYGGKLIFAADNGVNGIELWESDGTTLGTILISDMRSGASDSNPNGFHEFNSQIYFSAAGVQNKYNLFSTDGIAISSYPQIRSGTGSASPRLFTTFGSLLVFSARPSAFNQSTPFYGEEIMGFNGSPWTGGGDQIMIKDINPQGNSSSPDFYTEYNNLLYFAATDDGTNGRELWVTNGTNLGTNLLFDINSGAASSNPADLITISNNLYFTADDGVNGRELWISDGTLAGTQRFSNINPIAADLDNPENLTIFNNALYFTATHPTLGTEIFKLGGTTISNLKNIASGSGDSNPSNLYASSNRLYFSADNTVNGIELWSTTGFSATTNMVKDINTSPSSADSNPIGFTEYNGKVYFSATNGANGTELWVTDGTNAGTFMISDINPSGNSNPIDLIVANNLLFFSADNGSAGNELWKYQDPTLSTSNFVLENTRLYPNPIKDSFSLEAASEIMDISIFDISGKQIKNFERDRKEYSVGDLAPGVYFVNIQTEKGKITKKVVKE
ncbi:T9SS type A sorting domain-containing protein [Hyunsoonleella flava]|uniref:T9SS type A sorting domain-containing protein n=2 Tax=Pseudomonadati TaxID=3379134 RepID=A0A4Q9FDR0_9FLAO|nr:ELWxxDGT repeat protein [Hyunsoonleella flava]TBN01314.1 T9SS type A sorting domain-containing protein [Hyunsoonleella flava]